MIHDLKSRTHHYIVLQQAPNKTNVVHDSNYAPEKYAFAPRTRQKHRRERLGRGGSTRAAPASDHMRGGAQCEVPNRPWEFDHQVVFHQDRIIGTQHAGGLRGANENHGNAGVGVHARYT